MKKLTNKSTGEMIQTNFTFSWALSQLKQGNCISRAGWNGKGMWLELQVPDEHSKMSLPYIFMQTACGNKVPWLASQTDLMSDDWCYADLADRVGEH